MNRAHYQCYRRRATTQDIDGFANHKRAPHIASAGFISVKETFFRCYFDEDGVTDPADKKIAELTRQNLFGLLDAVTRTMLERGQWDVLGVTEDELQRLTDEAREDVRSNPAERGYYWTHKRSSTSRLLAKYRPLYRHVHESPACLGLVTFVPLIWIRRPQLKFAFPAEVGGTVVERAN
ncbi:MAG: hypothetical protein Q9207_006818 [Kuettlingeria erythrocarpa]